MRLPPTRRWPALILLLACTAEAEPFQTRDQNPLLTDLGLPVSLPAQVQSRPVFVAVLDVHWSNTDVEQRAADERLSVDAEMRDLRLSLHWSLGPHWSLQATLPYRYLGGGVLDSFIDGWHDAFGMREGARPLHPPDAFRVRYLRDDVVLADWTTSESGFGNLSLYLGRQLVAHERVQATFWLSTKLPTSRFSQWGSDTLDVSAILSAALNASPRVRFFGQAAATYFEQDRALRGLQKRAAWSTTLGTSVRTWRALSLRLQLDAHTALLDSPLDFLDDAVVLTVGGTYDFGPWRMEVGVSEDIAVDHSPDVVFLLGVHYRAR